MPHFDRTRRLTAEALGTGFLVATVGGSGIMAPELAGGNGAIALLCNTINGRRAVRDHHNLRPALGGAF